MSRQGRVHVHNVFAGIIEETDDGRYIFVYDKQYLNSNLPPVSLTLPIREEPFESDVLFSFFDGLIPEGWLLQLTIKNWKINPKDRMGLLLNACRDCIGAVHVTPLENQNPEVDDNR